MNTDQPFVKKRSGTLHYTQKGLKPVMTFVSQTVHKKLLAIAVKEDRSLYATVKIILTKYTEARP